MLATGCEVQSVRLLAENPTKAVGVCWRGLGRDPLPHRSATLRGLEVVGTVVEDFGGRLESGEVGEGNAPEEKRQELNMVGCQ